MIKLNSEILDFTAFPNGETKLDEKQIYRALNDMKPNRITFKYENDGDLLRLIFVKKFLDNTDAKFNPVFLTIAYMPYSRMDRSENGSAFTLKYVAELINGLKFDSIDVIEPHSDVTLALLDNAFAVYPTVSLLDRVLDAVGFDKDKDFLFFPDAGAQKRYGKLKGFKTAVGYKTRDFETGKITGLQVLGAEGLEGSKVIILDDLCSYGGTFYGVYSDDNVSYEYGAAHELEKLGANEIYLFVAHVEHSILKGKVLNYNSPIKKVFAIDSIMGWIDVPKSVDDRIEIFSII